MREIFSGMAPELQHILFAFVVGGLGSFLLLLVLGAVSNVKMQLKNQEINKRAAAEVDRLLAEMSMSEALSDAMQKHWALCEEERDLNPSLHWEKFQAVQEERIHTSRVIEILSANKIAVIFPGRKAGHREGGAI